MCENRTHLPPFGGTSGLKSEAPTRVTTTPKYYLILLLSIMP